MFESLREAFREATENFKKELNRDAVPEAADKLLRAMNQELVDSRLRLGELSDQLERTRTELESEDGELRTCLRREELARRIGDDETARVASEFAARHLRRRDVLEEKVAVLEKELADRRDEMQAMTEQLKEARTRRDSLTATAGRTGARDRIEEADDLFARMDEMAERISDFDARAQAAQEFGEMNLDGVEASTWDRERSEKAARDDVDARLEELKRRMGRDG
ncbi:MAG: hypothetical protein EA351_05730 [Gemmatimonadales bacterium]|nr:MAG: hypothetical protein EA351_05730 [Gemmatimonadales bacterium]